MTKPDVRRVEYSGGSAAPPGDINVYAAGPDIDVYSWSPAPAGTRDARPTQVHVHLHVEGGIVLVRFKGTDGIDAVIDALVHHREHVWGKR